MYLSVLNPTPSGEISLPWHWVWWLGEVCDAAGAAGCDSEMQSDSRPEGSGQESLPSVLPSSGQRKKGQIIASVLGLKKENGC